MLFKLLSGLLELGAQVENLAYFMRFAQAALSKAAADMERQGRFIDCLATFPLPGKGPSKALCSELRGFLEFGAEEDIDRPFQSLDFLVRDWRHFRDDWSVEQCKEQMEQHLSRHVNPAKMVENSTAEALHAMFKRLSCFCLPRAQRHVLQGVALA